MFFLNESLSSVQPQHPPITVGELAESAISLAEACYEMSAMNEALLGADFKYNSQLSESSDEGEKKSVLKKIIDKLRQWLQAVAKYLKKARDYIVNLFRRIFGIKPKQPAKETKSSSSPKDKDKQPPAVATHTGGTHLPATTKSSAEHGTVEKIDGTGHDGSNHGTGSSVGRVRHAALPDGTKQLPAPKKHEIALPKGIMVNEAVLDLCAKALYRLDNFEFEKLAKPVNAKELARDLSYFEPAEDSRKLYQLGERFKSDVKAALASPKLKEVRDLKEIPLIQRISKSIERLMASFGFAEHAESMLRAEADGGEIDKETLSKLRAVVALMSSELAPLLNAIASACSHAVKG